MPELPEVESVRRALESTILGRRIERISTSRKRLREPIQPALLQRQLVGAEVRAIRRRAKYLLLDVDRGGALVIHLGMSGRLLVQGREQAPPKHTHLTLTLDDGRELRFEDPRRFGLARWLAQPDEARYFAATGVEPFDAGLAERLWSASRRRRSTIKAMLLDQHVVAGIGNIYADEALFRAAIRPRHPVGKLTRTRIEGLAGAIVATLESAIRAGGTTIRDYAHPDGWPGGFAVELAAYGRVGESCRRCQATMVGGRVAGRGTTWCRSCQK